MNDQEYPHTLEFSVRDYECDLQGVVNNANYQHYLEHARHVFLESQGISFSQLHEEGLDLIVARIEIDYKYPLRSHDKFFIKTTLLRQGNVRLVFVQDIFRIPDEKLVLKARVTGAAVRNGKPVFPAELLKKLGLE
ncbi:MAG: acyl-CoA thioesterase [Bacteroidales bacterium]|jgi:acyl-CoA thioester hydrolase|nr:acyl-CoA thioesterase [Bacteroidales bacterium]